MIGKMSEGALRRNWRSKRHGGLVVSIVGTRPEAIKMAPLARAIAERGLDHRIILSGQHAGLGAMFDGVAADLIWEMPYDPRGRTPRKLRESLHAALCGQFSQARPELVLVHGDTTTALAGAFAARDCGIPIGHVEAGLRSHDFRQPWPEEGNRVAIDAMADLLFAPTEAAAANLYADWRAKGEVHVTGNTGIDALFHARDAAPMGAELSFAAGRHLILATCHRKENQGEPTRAVCAALVRLAETLSVEIVVPLHPNRHVRREMEDALSGQPWICLIEPLDYPAMVQLITRAWLILSDSGGLQEEGPAFGTPVLVLRDVTERGEALASGSIELIGTDEERIVASVTGLFGDKERYARMARPSLPFGDGRAAPRIVRAIERWFAAGRSRAA